MARKAGGARPSGAAAAPADPIVEITAGETALFASDMHLCDLAPDTRDAFLDRIRQAGAAADHLFLLGDVFEAWVGDDGADATAGALADTLRRLAAGGTRVWLMRGNRDFLLDAPLPHAPATVPFSSRCGAVMLDDPVVARVHGRRVVLSHGDALCTDDEVYQAWRSTCRDARWQHEFLALPLPQRQALARRMRDASEAGKREKPGHIMDVNRAAVVALMDSLAAPVMIHGHTHRPARHRLGDRVRWVLPDWDAASGRGGLLRASGGRLSMLPAPARAVGRVSR